MIEIQGLTVVLGRTIALDQIELTIGPGISGLFGPNGSGKTTLLRSLAGFLPATAGEATIFGIPASSKKEALQRMLGYAGHESGMYGELSVIENLKLFAHLYGASSGRPDELVDQLEISDHRDTPVARLSAGMKRRAAVARALVHDPRVLFLDEPYANLDDVASESVSNVIRAWSDPERIAVIATHGAKKVRAYATDGIVLQRGRLVRHGSYLSPATR
jgi:heme ABC exporter ATP-binding subunit CcmA